MRTKILLSLQSRKTQLKIDFSNTYIQYHRLYVLK